MTIQLSTVQIKDGLGNGALWPVKYFPTVTECHIPIPCSHVIVIWVLGNLFTFVTSCQAPRNTFFSVGFHRRSMGKLAGKLASRQYLQRGLPLGAGWTNYLPNDFTSLPAWISVIQKGKELTSFTRLFFKATPREEGEPKSKQNCQTLNREVGCLGYRVRSASRSGMEEALGPGTAHASISLLRS